MYPHQIISLQLARCQPDGVESASCAVVALRVRACKIRCSLCCVCFILINIISGFRKKKKKKVTGHSVGGESHWSARDFGPSLAAEQRVGGVVDETTGPTITNGLNKELIAFVQYASPWSHYREGSHELVRMYQAIRKADRLQVRFPDAISRLLLAYFVIDLGASDSLRNSTVYMHKYMQHIASLGCINHFDQRVCCVETHPELTVELTRIGSTVS